MVGLWYALRRADSYIYHFWIPIDHAGVIFSCICTREMLQPTCFKPPRVLLQATTLEHCTFHIDQISEAANTISTVKAREDEQRKRRTAAEHDTEKIRKVSPTTPSK